MPQKIDVANVASVAKQKKVAENQRPILFYILMVIIESNQYGVGSTFSLASAYFSISSSSAGLRLPHMATVCSPLK